MAFKKNTSDTELAVLRTLQEIPKYDYLVKFDIQAAYDTVRKELVSNMLH